MLSVLLAIDVALTFLTGMSQLFSSKNDNTPAGNLIHVFTMFGLMTLSAVAAAKLGMFAFVWGICLASFYGIGALLNLMCLKPRFLITCPMCVLLIIALCKFTI